MNYFEFYPGDYLRDTTSLNLTEHGAYLKLLIAYYSEEKPLPADLKKLYVITSAISAADKAATRKVAEEFFPIADDGFRHKNRVDAEIAKAQRRIQIAQQNGSKGGRKPNPAGNPPGNPSGNPVGYLGGNPEETQRATQSGEALHTPHAIHHQEQQLEARTEIPTQAGTDAGRACLLLRQAGCARVNASHPDLLAALAEGVTPEAIRDTYAEAPGKANPFAYAIATARSRHAEGAKTVSTGPPPARAMQISKTGMAVQALEAMKSENRLGDGRNLDGPAEAGLPRLGSTAGG
jgi:uncharacterized protein YdaU (DUF1376 family)